MQALFIYIFIRNGLAVVWRQRQKWRHGEKRSWAEILCIWQICNWIMPHWVILVCLSYTSLSDTCLFELYFTEWYLPVWVIPHWVILACLNYTSLSYTCLFELYFTEWYLPVWVKLHWVRLACLSYISLSDTSLFELYFTEWYLPVWVICHWVRLACLSFVSLSYICLSYISLSDTGLLSYASLTEGCVFECLFSFLRTAQIKFDPRVSPVHCHTCDDVSSDTKCNVWTKECENTDDVSVTLHTQESSPLYWLKKVVPCTD